MKKYLVLFLLVTVFFGCSKEDEKDETGPDYSETVVGTWKQIAYLSSDGSFIEQEDGTYFQFSKDKTFLYYNGGIFKETTTGTFSMPFESVIKLDDGDEKAHSSPAGYRFEIEILTKVGNEWTFKILDGTSSSTIKVKKQ